MGLSGAFSKPTSKTPLRLLLVDDSEEYRDLFKQIAGDSVEFVLVGEAADVESGAAMAKLLRPDLMVVDVEMPERSGFELARIVAQALPGTKTVMMSVSDYAEYRVLARTSGAVAFIPKSRMFPNELMKVLA